ncbi:hypothetical protein, partial [Novipirellula maiorica]
MLNHCHVCRQAGIVAASAFLTAALLSPLYGQSEEYFDSMQEEMEMGYGGESRQSASPSVFRRMNLA